MQYLLDFRILISSILLLTFMSCKTENATVKSVETIEPKKEQIVNNEEPGMPTESEERALAEELNTDNNRNTQSSKCSGWLFRYGSVMGDVISGKEGADRNLERLLKHPVYEECKDDPEFIKEFNEVNALRKKK